MEKRTKIQTAHKLPGAILSPNDRSKYGIWNDNIAHLYGESGARIFSAISGGENPYSNAQLFQDEMSQVDRQVIKDISERYQVSESDAVMIYQNGYMVAANSIGEVVETVMPQEYVDAFQTRNEAIGATRKPQDQLLRLITPVDRLGDYEVDRLHYFAQYGMDVAALHLRNDFPGQLMYLIDHLNRNLFDLNLGESVSVVKQFNVIHNNANNAAIGIYDGNLQIVGDDQHIKKYYMAMREINGIKCATHPSLKTDSSALMKAHSKGGMSEVHDFVRMMLIVEGGKEERDEVVYKMKETFRRSEDYLDTIDDNDNDGRGGGDGTVDWARFKLWEAGSELPIEVACMDHLAYFNYRNKISNGRDKAWRLYGFDRVVDKFRYMFPPELYTIDGVDIEEILNINRESIIADLRNSRVSKLTGKIEQMSLIESLGS